MDQLIGWGLLAAVIGGVFGVSRMSKGGGMGDLGRRPKLSAGATRFIHGKVRKLMHEGFDQRRAIAASFSMARAKGYAVPPKPY